MVDVPEWAIERVAELTGYYWPNDVNEGHRVAVAFARYITEHEEPPGDPDMPDGIDCRNETIRLQDEKIKRYEAELATQNATGSEAAGETRDGLSPSLPGGAEMCSHVNAGKGAWSLDIWHCPDCKAKIDLGDPTNLRIETYPDGRVVTVPRPDNALDVSDATAAIVRAAFGPGNEDMLQMADLMGAERAFNAAVAGVVPLPGGTVEARPNYAEFAEALLIAAGMYDDVELAFWLTAPQPVIGMWTPVQLLARGEAAKLLEVLRGLEEGAYL